MVDCSWGCRLWRRRRRLLLDIWTCRRCRMEKETMLATEGEGHHQTLLVLRALGLSQQSQERSMLGNTLGKSAGGRKLVNGLAGGASSRGARSSGGHEQAAAASSSTTVDQQQEQLLPSAAPTADDGAAAGGHGELSGLLSQDWRIIVANLDFDGAKKKVRGGESPPPLN
mmetsp:Transcript_35587/g.58548  ORF Transcript_35587/g.58548 Transcript_35587/m.58548 type:complete len:170 (-) Transcript_35587:8-517(-)